MKRTLFTSALLISSLLFITTKVSAQGSTGLIAHWDFNGSTNDITGNGNDGIPHNVTPDVGRSGLPNTAYYLDGLADTTAYSWIEIPYHSDLNLTQYSICATIKVYGFNSESCQNNTVFERGKERSPDNYFLCFTDNGYDKGDCSLYNPDEDAFVAGAGTSSGPIAAGWYSNTPIKPNVWTTVVATFDSSYASIYVNGTLKRRLPYKATIASDTEGASIGLGYYPNSSYPNPFNGLIDDIRLYNRPLSAAEARQYDSSTLAVNAVTKNTPSVNIYPNPAKNIIYIQGNTINGDIHIKVCNTIGQLVKNITLSNGQRQLSVADLVPAVYFLQIQTEYGQIATKEFVKQ